VPVRWAAPTAITGARLAGYVTAVFPVLPALAKWIAPASRVAAYAASTAAEVPPYQLPPALVSAEGRPITTAQEWFQIRRPQLISLFGNLVYGVVPKPEVPVQTWVEVLKTDREFFGGKAMELPLRDPLTMKPMDTPQPSGAAPKQGQ
jgi:hypothetical protein